MFTIPLAFAVLGELRIRHTQKKFAGVYYLKDSNGYTIPTQYTDASGNATNLPKNSNSRNYETRLTLQ